MQHRMEKRKQIEKESSEEEEETSAERDLRLIKTGKRALIGTHKQVKLKAELTSKEMIREY